MAGYVIVDLQVTDAEVYAEFREKVAGTVEAHGGKYLVRGGTPRPSRATGRRSGSS